MVTNIVLFLSLSLSQVFFFLSLNIEAHLSGYPGFYMSAGCTLSHHFSDLFFFFLIVAKIITDFQNKIVTGSQYSPHLTKSIDRYLIQTTHLNQTSAIISTQAGHQSSKPGIASATLPPCFVHPDLLLPFFPETLPSHLEHPDGLLPSLQPCFPNPALLATSATLPAWLGTHSLGPPAAPDLPLFSEPPGVYSELNWTHPTSTTPQPCSEEESPQVRNEEEGGVGEAEVFIAKITQLKATGLLGIFLVYHFGFERNFLCINLVPRVDKCSISHQRVHHMIMGTHAFKFLIDCTDSRLLIFIGQSKTHGNGFGVEFLVLVFVGIELILHLTGG
ncbi:putative signal peptide protein [Puccinia sorghi]|uniref:Putative signal peptide protein n=1 Tax=Puccinia sorghi TaxID=27349 RepID=A0A0L6VU11_9BASI|nr:putative signal peptide protein [Puccinia sorghi]